jgi:hypothetical protein
MATWVEQETALSMLQHLLLGTELQLYQASEYCMVYWYCDYLVTCSLQAMRKRAVFKLSMLAGSSKEGSSSGSSSGSSNGAAAGSKGSSKPSLARGKGGKQGGSKASAQQQAQLEAQQAAQQLEQRMALQLEVHSELLRLETLRLASQGILRLCVGLKLAGLLPDPELQFNSQLQRFDQRFASFHMLQRPEPLQYESFEASVDPGEHKADFLLQLAADNFTQVGGGCLGWGGRLTCSCVSAVVWCMCCAVLRMG